MQENTRKTLKNYLRASWRYKFALFVIALAVIGASGADVIVPLFFKHFFDVLASGMDRAQIADGLIQILIAIFWIEIAQWVFWRISTFTASHFQTRVIADLTNQAFQYLHQHSFAFFDNNFVGSLTKKVKWFSKAFGEITDQVIFNILPLIVNIIVIVLVLWQRNYLLGAGILLWILFFLGVNTVFIRYKLKYDILRAAKETETTGILADTITNNKNIKLFNGYEREVKFFGRAVDELRRLMKFSWNLNNYLEMFQGILMVILEIGVFYLAIRLWQKGILTVGDFVLLQAYIINIFLRVWDFGRIIRHIYESLADAEEMTVILNEPHEIQDALDAKKLKVSTGAIDFRDVDFYYHQTRRVLKDFNLRIKGGEKVALVGPSGSGKTTIVKLLLRMHNVTSGEILIDNQNLARITQESLHANISLVPQDPILFHRNILENIRYGNPKAKREAVIKAAKIARCHDFIQDLPEGYNTFVGERGIKLSGGERQRVAIARAILRDAPILILDEATSSLDSESESLIQKALDNLMRGKTVIVVAHRLSTIKKMDRILVIDRGKIIEQGKHNDLIAGERGKYKKLWEIQAGSFVNLTTRNS